MAKQKNTTDEVTAEEVVTPFQDNTQTPESPSSESEPTPQVEKEKPKQEEPDEFVKNILGTFPRYKTLYVDRHGGVFTADTPKNIRGDAALYNNPFFKQ